MEGCPCGRTSAPDSASHSRIVLSSETDTMQVLSGDATDRTRCPCPRIGGKTSVHDSGSHTRMVLSLEPDTMRVPSEENAIDLMQWSCPCGCGATNSVPDRASHTRTVLSSAPDAMR